MPYASANQGISDAPQILILEDDAMWLQVLMIRLESSDYNIQATRTVVEGLALLTDQKFSLLLLDWHLPGTDGKTLLSNIRQIDPTLPIIILSAHVGDREKKQALKLGAHALVTKPISNDQWRALEELVLEIVRP